MYVLFISFSLRYDSCCMYELFLFDCLCFVHFFLVNFWFSLHVWAFSFWLTFLHQSLSCLPLSLRSFFVWLKKQNILPSYKSKTLFILAKSQKRFWTQMLHDFLILYQKWKLKRYGQAMERTENGNIIEKCVKKSCS